MRLKFQERSKLKLLSRNETQTLEVKRIKVCLSNYQIAKGYWKPPRKRSLQGLETHCEKRSEQECMRFSYLTNVVWRSEYFFIVFNRLNDQISAFL